MKYETFKKATWLASAITALYLLTSATAHATCWHCEPPVTNITEVTEVTNVYETYLTETYVSETVDVSAFTTKTNELNQRLDDFDSQYMQTIAIGSAIANIPSLSHDSKLHNHTGVGVGLGNYGSKTAIAFGVMHMKDDNSFKATIGATEGEQVYGAGYTRGFQF